MVLTSTKKTKRPKKGSEASKGSRRAVRFELGSSKRIVEPNEFTVEDLEKVFSETPRYGKRGRLRHKPLVDSSPLQGPRVDKPVGNDEVPESVDGPLVNDEAAESVDEPPKGESTGIDAFEERMKRISRESLLSLYDEINKIHDSVEKGGSGDDIEGEEKPVSKKNQNLSNRKSDLLSKSDSSFKKPNKGGSFHVEPSARTSRLLARRNAEENIDVDGGNEAVEQKNEVPMKEKNQFVKEKIGVAREKNLASRETSPIDKESQEMENASDKQIKGKKRVTKTKSSKRAPERQQELPTAETNESTVKESKPTKPSKPKPAFDIISLQNIPLFANVWMKTKTQTYRIRKYQEMSALQRSKLTHYQLNSLFPDPDPFNMLQPNL